MWSSEQEDSEVSASACIADDFKPSQCAADDKRRGCSRAAAVASKLKLSYITSQAQLQVRKAQLHRRVVAGNSLNPLVLGIIAAANTMTLIPRAGAALW